MRIGLLALGLLALATPAVAAPQRQAIPLFGRTLSFDLPAGFAVANRQQNARAFLMELVPAGETIETWTRLVTVRALVDFARPGEKDASVARRIFDTAAFCPKTALYADGGARTIAPALSRTVLVTGCGTLPAGAYPAAMAGAGEEDFILMMRAGNNIYTLNYAVRGAPYNVARPPVAPSGGTAQLARFGKVTLCSGAATAACTILP